MHSAMGVKMNIPDVLDNLKDAKPKSRALDVQIAQALGWRRRMEHASDPDSGEIKPKAVWLLPNSDEISKVPSYAANLQAAFDLAHQLYPSHVGACSWEQSMECAQIGMNNTPVRGNACTSAVHCGFGFECSP